MLRNTKRFEAAVRKGVVRGAQRSRARIQRATPKDTGQTKASWRISVSPATKSIEQTVVIWKNDAPHAGVLELGARPHGMSPAGWAAIYNWVRRHGKSFNVARKRDARGKFLPGARVAGDAAGAYKGPDPEISAITNAIVQKIAKEGQRPRYFVRNILDELRAMAAAEVQATVTELMARAK